MKFTLTPNDELKFKIVSYSTTFLDETLIKNFHFCDSFYYWIQEHKEVDRNNCYFDNIWLDFYKGLGEISYKLEDIKLIYHGDGNKSKIYKIEVTIKKNTPKAKIKIFVERSYSLSEKTEQVIASVLECTLNRIEKNIEQIAKKKNTDIRAIKNIIKDKTKKTITDKY